jgi:hypothetical protein
MAISITSVTGTGTGVDATSFSVSLTTDPATLYVACLEASRDTSNPPTPTVTHGGITATQVATLLWITTGASRRQLWIYAWDSGPGSGPGTWLADFGVTMSGCSMGILKVTGSDIANGLVQTFVQTAATGADLSGTSGATGTLSAAGDSNNRVMALFCHQANEESTVEGGWTALTNQTHNNPSSGMKPGWHASTFDTTPTMSWTTSSPYGGLAAEIKVAGAGGGGGVSDPFGMSGFFGG